MASYEESGIEGLGDAPRPGKPRKIDDLAIIADTLSNDGLPVTLLIAPSPEDDGSCRPANPGMVSCPCISNSPGGVLPPGLDGSEVIANQGHGARNTGRQS